MAGRHADEVNEEDLRTTIMSVLPAVCLGREAVVSGKSGGEIAMACEPVRWATVSIARQYFR